MNVPRGTSWPSVLRASPRAVFRVTMLPYQLRALAAGGKSQHRIPVSAENSTVHPGKFSGLDLSSGRARQYELPNIPELRARCTFESGNRRAVTIRPKFIPGDLLWVYDPKGKKRGASKFTLEVASVGISRVQDLSNADARAEGTGQLHLRERMNAGDGVLFTDAGVYGWALRQWHRADPRRPDLWADNAWVWVVQFVAHPVQVDRLLAQWGTQ